MFTVTETNITTSTIGYAVQLPGKPSHLTTATLVVQESFCPEGSSCIKRVDYYPEPEALFVEFVDGEWYRYDDVDADVFEDFACADSAGSFFNQYVRDHYDWAS